MCVCVCCVCVCVCVCLWMCPPQSHAGRRLVFFFCVCVTLYTAIYACPLCIANRLIYMCPPQRQLRGAEAPFFFSVSRSHAFFPPPFLCCSHAFFVIRKVVSTAGGEGGEGATAEGEKKGKKEKISVVETLRLVDLAGSERNFETQRMTAKQHQVRPSLSYTCVYLCPHATKCV
jgi:hypothetical protein